MILSDVKENGYKMKIKKLCLLSIGMSFLLCTAANSNCLTFNSLQLNNRVQKAGKAANQKTFSENDAKKDDDFDYQLGALDDTYISNPGDEFESKNVFESANAKYRFDSYKNYPYITHLYDKYNGQDKDIEYARIYIWDVNVRAAIYAVAQELLNQIDEKLNDKLDEINKVNMSINGASIVVSFGSIALSIANLANIAVSITGPLGLAVSISSTVIIVVGQFFSAYFNSDYTSKLRDFRDFLINLKAAIEVSRYSTNKEVVMMRFRYRFGSEFDWGTKYYIDFHPVYRISDTNLYNSNYIGYISDESPINGTVHGFKNASQISSYLR